MPPQGRVRYQLKTPWRNGTTHVEWDPVDFIAKLAALVAARRPDAWLNGRSPGRHLHAKLPAKCV